ncbi:predicted protein [Arabidopsis lyrata subsp. lyrata]|uniref:Predicted protein n=1 Tax=Arabidopsis lyrata subsp. lyrata TaxID=81972 RepID=D7KF27_ARALL|nr:predicted protein [Arabidopsis lyrata subsp. lyrata]
MRGTTEEEDGFTSFSDVLMLFDDVLSSGDVGEDGFGFTGNETSQMKKRISSGDEHDRVCDPKPGKRCKRDQTKSSVGNAKVKKEKVGERITALQQLVSPYGKTDTASVLHETMGYIKFLQDQVQVLSTPYFKHNPLVRRRRHRRSKPDDESERVEKQWFMSCSTSLDRTRNGVDLWSSAIYLVTSHTKSEPVETVEVKSYKDKLFDAYKYFCLSVDT